MGVTETMLKEISDSFTGESRFCEIVQDGRVLAWGMRLLTARAEIQNGYWGKGTFLITQRLKDRTVIHESVTY